MPVLFLCKYYNTTNQKNIEWQDDYKHFVIKEICISHIVWLDLIGVPKWLLSRKGFREVSQSASFAITTCIDDGFHTLGYIAATRKPENAKDKLNGQCAWRVRHVLVPWDTTVQWKHGEWVFNLILHPSQLEVARPHHLGPRQTHPCVWILTSCWIVDFTVFKHDSRRHARISEGDMNLLGPPPGGGPRPPVFL